jgi:hypothetical protein
VIGQLYEAASRGLTRNVAFTAPGAEDRRLMGRTYAVPFDVVWKASLRLIGGRLRRWEILEADDTEGIIRGVAHGRVARFTSNVTVRILLDPDAQTRVDMLSASRVGRADFGVNARRIHRFFRGLDALIERDRGVDIESVRVHPVASPAGPST